MLDKKDFNLLIKNNGSKNLGWKTNRLEYDPHDIENAFSSIWQKHNIKERGINYGNGILQDLFFESSGNPLSVFNPTVKHLKINNRDRLIVATVIQWLGTNVGFCFLREVLKKAGYNIVKIKENE